MDANSPPLGGYEFLVGGGEMGDLIRSKDWANTSLGAIEVWPQSLRTVLFLMLHSRYPMFVWWGRELINFYNDAYIPVLGARHPEALGQSASRIWAEIWNVIGPQTEAVMREGRATWNESILLVMERHGYTEETYFTFSYSPALDDDGNVGGVFCACTEDTKRIVGERRLRTLRVLAEQATHAKSVEEACGIAAATMRENPYDLPFALIYLLDVSGTRVRLAGEALSESRASPAEIELRDATNGSWPLAPVLASGESQVVSDFEARFGPGVKLPGGAWPEASRQAVVLPLARPGQMEPYGFLVAGISPRLLLDDDYRGFLQLTAGHIASAIANARAHEEERKRVEALAQIDRAKTAFFNNVSHEFRTPLTLILGPTEEMLSGALGETNAIQREHLLTLRFNAVRLQKLVNALLDYARVEAGRIEATYEPVDIGMLTREFASTFCSAVHRAGLLYVVKCPSIESPVYVDRDMWEKVVLNLLSNALKFTFHGAIEVSVQAQGDRVNVTVRDTGVGIPDEELPYLFERFHRVHRSRARTQEGSGIGLALVHELVRLHGGSLQVDSTVDSGTAFTITLPMGFAHLPKERIAAARTLTTTALGATAYVEEALRWLPDSGLADAVDLDANPQKSVSKPRSMPAGAERILIADDNADMRNYLKRLLEIDWRVTTANDGAQALEIARTTVPDLILSDVMMPGLDGFELLGELRKDHRTSTIPIILLSARAGEEAKVEGLNAGADDYIVKPFSARELVARVKALLDIMRVRRESEERFRTMADSSPIMIWMTDPSGKILFLNRAYLDYFGIERDKIGSFVWPEIIHPADREAYVGEFQLALRERRPFYQRARLRRADGQWRWFEARGNPILNGDGEMTGYIGSSPDITDIYESQQALKELDERKDEFLANMSHEIRSPLTAIMGYADILLGKFRDPEDLEALRTIKESGDYLIEIVNDILDLSKIEAGKLVLMMEPVSVHSLLAELHNLMDVRAREKSLPLVLRYDGALPETIQTDRTRLRQILINLISNAIKFTEHGRVEIIAKFDDREGLLQVDVADTGIGIAPEEQAMLFHPFNQADSTSSRKYGGTGLGLSITRRLVDALGGSIWLESERNKGSLFRVVLPVGVGSNASGGSLRAWDRVRRDDKPLRDRRILVVDDREEICKLVSKYIEDAGGRAEGRNDGASAVDAIAKASAPFDAVILDIHMPVMDGYEVARTLRAKGNPIPIIALTASAMVGDREKCLHAGCDDYLTKPIDRDRLVQALAHQTQRKTPLAVKKDNLKILLVDDSEAACKLMSTILHRRGYEVRSALDGHSAIDVALTFHPDVLFLDMRLPDMTGNELLHRLKTLGVIPHAKFIGLSGYRASDTPGATDFDHFLEKPLDAACLETVLSSL